MLPVTLKTYAILPLLLFTSFFLLLQTPVHAEEVTARSFQKSERVTVIDISFQQPVPPTIIVEMSLPKITGSIKAEPKFSKFNRKKGTLKWLLKDIRSQTVSITVHTEAALNLAQTEVVVRYRSRSSGSMKEISARRDT